MEKFTTAIKNPLFLKGLLVMKLTIAFMVFFTFQASAHGFGQVKLNVKAKKTEISNVLSLIEKQTNFRFLYNSNLKDIREKTSVNATNANIQEVLQQLLSDTHLIYQIMDNNLIVIREGKANDFEDIVQAVVSGRVTDETGAPMAGVSVQIKGSTRGTMTDNDGRFSINAEDNDVLVFSYVGYEPQEISVAGKTEINVVLVAAKGELQQVVVIGYGTQRKIDVTGSVASVSGEEISKQVSVNPLSALQGKVSGVQVTNSGEPGKAPQIKIRGVGTVYGNTNALYVVDGVWFDDISFLNPSDIENISILKDASAEAIYGIRAANGVVLVTTKKGKGKVTVNYNGYIGLQRVTNQIEMANASEYATLINELNGTQTFPDPASYGEGTNWFDAVLQNALITNHYLSASGGGEKSNYNFSLGYLKQEGIVTGNDYTRITARFQNDIQATSFLKLGYSAVFQGSNAHDVPGDVVYKAYTAAPVVPVKYSDGTYGDPADYPIGTATNNPKAQLDFFNQKTKDYRVSGNVYGEVKLLNSLTYRVSFGGEYGEQEVRGYVPVYYANSIQFATESQLSISRIEARNWIVENTLTFNKTFNDHRLTVLAGQSAQRYKSYAIDGTARNVPYNTEGDLYIALGPDSTRTIVDRGDLATYTSYFGRVNYSFKNRYLLTASIRADGSSKFVEDERWGYFPSVGVGWIISDEPFMKNQNVFNNLKLRGSWGKIGNASVPTNLAVLRVNRGANLTAVFGQPGQPFTGASITTIVPPLIVWEKGEGVDGGLEGTLLNNQLNFEIDYYYRETQDAIFDVPVLGSLGLSGGTILGNQATFRNSGFEFAAGWKSSPGKSFTYSINGNFSVNSNKVKDVLSGNIPLYGGGEAATGGQLSTITVQGSAIGQFYGLVVDGIFQTPEEVANGNQPDAQPGDFKYKDINGDKVIDGKDRMVIGSPNPKYAFGLNSNFAYKGFDLTLDLQGVAGVDVYNANKGKRFGAENYTKDFYDNRWHGEGTSNTYPSARVGGGRNYLPNTWFVEDGSYVRIRNVQLGYTLPQGLTSKWKLERVRVYANAQNVLNIFGYNGFTPEVTAISPTSAGIDMNIYPLSATYNFGLNVTF